MSRSKMAACDTSFLCALYLPQVNSPTAFEWYKKSTDRIVVTDLVLMEFRHSVRLQSWLHKQDKSKGFPEVQGQSALNALESHLSQQLLHQVDYSWSHVQRLTERI